MGHRHRWRDLDGPWDTRHRPRADGRPRDRLYDALPRGLRDLARRLQRSAIRARAARDDQIPPELRHYLHERPWGDAEGES